MSKGTTRELGLHARALNDQFEKIQWKGKDVYRTPGSNAIALKDVITKLSAVIPEGTDGLKDHLETANALIQAAVLTDKNFVELDAASRSRCTRKNRRRQPESSEDDVELGPDDARHRIC